jgi:hypothetical protein
VRPAHHHLIPALLAALLFAAAETATAKPEASDSWYDFRFHGSKVGFLHAVDTVVELDGKPALYAARTSLITVKRQDHVIRMESHTEAWCTPEGAPLKFRHVRTEGGAERVVEGRREGDVLLITMNVGGSMTQHRIPLEPGLALATNLDALHKNALAKGYSVKGRTIVEEEAAIQEYSIAVKSIDTTSKPPIFVLESKMGQLTSSERVQGGRTISTKVERLGAEFVLTTREKAVAGVDPTDIFTASRLSSHAQLPRGETLRSVVVDLISRSGRTPAPILDSRQKKVHVKRGRVRLEIGTPVAPPAGVAWPKKTAELARYLGGTPYEPIEDPRLVEASKKAVAGAKDPFAAARAINTFVYGHITRKSLGKAFSSAIEALTQKEGDCTEHAVLFSALAKIAGLPTRLVTGLVYVGGEDGGFGYHEWVEVWLGSAGWVAMDPTFGQDLADPTHVKFTEGLSDAEGLREAGVAAAELFGDLQLEVVSHTTLTGKKVVH